MRKERVDAGDSLLRILCVHLIFRFPILFRNRKNTQSLDGFEWVGGFWTHRADANG